MTAAQARRKQFQFIEALCPALTYEAPTGKFKANLPAKRNSARVPKAKFEFEPRAKRSTKRK